MGTNLSRFYSYLLISFVLGVFLFFLLILFLLPQSAELPWRGYYRVLLSKELDIGEVSRRLAAAGLGEILSVATAEVEFSDFDVMEKIAVQDITRRLHPEDPRWDEFLRGVEGLFYEASGREQIIYLPARQSPPFLAAKIRSVLPGAAFTILEWQGTRRFLLLLLFLLLGGLLIFQEEKKRLLYTLFALPWISLIHSPRPGAFAAGILAYGAIVRTLEEALPLLDRYLYDRASLRSFNNAMGRRSFYLGGVVLAALFLLGLGSGFSELLPFLLGLGGTAALVFALVLFRTERKQNRAHRLFVPIPILPHRWRARKTSGKEGASILVFVLLLMLPLIFRFTATEGKYLVPQPYQVSGLTGMSRESLRNLWLANRGEELPDFSDYLSHRAYQQGFFHGYPQVFPESGGAVTLSRFEYQEGGIKRWEEVVEDYDEAWYKNELKRAKGSALGALLHAQGPRGVSLESTGGEVLDLGYCIGYGLLLALGYLPLLFMSRGRGFQSIRALQTMATRRKRQEV